MLLALLWSLPLHPKEGKGDFSVYEQSLSCNANSSLPSLFCPLQLDMGSQRDMSPGNTQPCFCLLTLPSNETLDHASGPPLMPILDLRPSFSGGHHTCAGSSPIRRQVKPVSVTLGVARTEIYGSLVALFPVREVALPHKQPSLNPPQLSSAQHSVARDAHRPGKHHSTKE